MPAGGLPPEADKLQFCEGLQLLPEEPCQVFLLIF
jgi:hypothetical protein